MFGCFNKSLHIFLIFITKYKEKSGGWGLVDTYVVLWRYLSWSLCPLRLRSFYLSVVYMHVWECSWCNCTYVIQVVIVTARFQIPHTTDMNLRFQRFSCPSLTGSFGCWSYPCVPTWSLSTLHTKKYLPAPWPVDKKSTLRCSCGCENWEDAPPASPVKAITA